MGSGGGDYNFVNSGVFRWRIAEVDVKCDKNNGAVRNPSQDSDVSVFFNVCVCKVGSSV